MKENILIILILACLNPSSIFAQIQTKQQALESIDWMINNPQIENDSLFANKLTDLLRWQMERDPNKILNVGGISEFQENSNGGYKLYGPIVSIYFVSTLINENYNINESAYYAIQNVLDYYKNSLEIDSTLQNDILNDYMSLTSSALKKKMKKLSEYK